MKRFMALFLGTPEAMAQWKALDENERKEKEKVGMEGWGAWMKKHQSSILEGGSPLGKTKRIGKNGISDMRNEVGAFAIVEAESHEAAAKLFENHPHFTIFPGDRVELMECLPIPEMKE